MKIQIKSYKGTNIYENGKGTIKDEIKAYKERNNLDNDALYLELRLYDLKHIDPQLNKRASSGAAFAAAISGLSLIFISQSSKNKTGMLINAIVFIVFFIMYVGGFTNQFQIEKRAIRKELKKRKIKEEFITEAEKIAKQKKEEDE